jgi:hypothetical protein
MRYSVWVEAPKGSVSMGRKLLLGCSVLAVLAVAGIVVLVTLNWDRSGIDVDSERGSLSQELQAEFGSQARVELECVLPLVGPAPCVLDGDSGSRHVRLTFIDYQLPEGAAPGEHARHIAVRAFEASEFVKVADRLEVIFEIMESGELGDLSQISKYSFGQEQLAKVVAATP